MANQAVLDGGLKEIACTVVLEGINGSNGQTARVECPTIFMMQKSAWTQFYHMSGWHEMELMCAVKSMVSV